MSADQFSSADELRRQVEDLATQLVLSEALSAPEARRALSEALGRIRAQAEEQSWHEVVEAAARLTNSLAQATEGTNPDLIALDRALKEGLGRLQQAVGKLTAEQGAGAEPAASGESQKNLAQDPDLLNEVILESKDHLTSVESRLLELELDPANAEAIHSIFRSFHTIKGLAGFLELTAIQEVAHEVETVLDLARNGKLLITPAVIDVVLESKDFLNQACGRLESALRGNAGGPEPDRGPLVGRIRELMKSPAAAPAPVEEAAADPESIEQSARQKTQRTLAEARPVRVDTAKLDYLADMAGEMVIAQSLIQHDPDLAALDSPRLQRSLAQLARITGELQKTAMSMRMVPIGYLFRRMIRLARDLSRQAGKQVELALSGEDTELDRTIVEALADPLIHMVRNAVDHGVERPEERRAAGKPPVGCVGLRAYHQAGHIMIAISDDGRGLAREKILARAHERGLISEGTHVSDIEILNLIFEPGFSTAERVTGISGRGVGMDVVRKQIQKLRGRIEIRSEAGRGTTFFLKLPLTLAIIDGLVVGVGRERYVVPIFAVREMFRPTRELISTVCNQDEMALVRGRLLPVLRLYRRFGVQPRSEDACESVFIVAESEGKPFCLMVDDFVGKQEVVIKSLGEALKNIPGIAGGAILGDGRVGLVLDIDGLFERSANG